jgi:hypothetical protein
MLVPQTEEVKSVNGEIAAKLTGPLEDQRMIAWIRRAEGISQADTKLLAGWFKNEELISKFAGRFGYVREIDNKLAIRTYDERDLAYQLEIKRPFGVDIFATIGKYYGYRTCCADYFSATKSHGIRPHLENTDWEKTHYIHCPQCMQVLMPDGNIGSYPEAEIDREIRDNRISPHAYPCTPNNSWVQYQVLDAVFRGHMPFSYWKTNSYQAR